ncbi:MAG: PucR family transcriptional regulator [Bacillota bacterium]
MGITVREALQLEELKGVQLVAGSNGLGRIINHVSVLEVPSNFNQWLQGNELILTTLYSFGDNAKAMVNLVEEFAFAGVAALGIHPGLKGDPLLPEMIERANLLGLPLLKLPRDMPYTTVISAILEAILNRQELLLRRSSQINRSMIKVILDEGDLQQIAATLSGLIKSPVAIADAQFKVLAFHGYDQFDHTFFDHLQQSPNYRQWLASFQAKMMTLPQAKTRDPFGTTLGVDGRNLNQMVWPISVGSGIEGYIFTWESHNHFSDIEKIAISHAVTAVALDLLKKKAVEEAERRFSNDFIGDLLEGNFSSEKAMFRRADALGIDISFFRIVISTDIDDFEKYLLGQVRKEQDIQNLKSSLYQTVRKVVEKHIPDSLVVSKSDSVIILPKIPNQTGEEEIYQKIRQMVQAVSYSVREKFSEITVSVGVGSICSTPGGLRQSYLEAHQALEIGRTIHGNGHISFFKDQGIYRLLWPAINEAWFRDFCQGQLQALLDYDTQATAQLVPTLETFLDADESLVQAAKALYLHPNTVRYRIDRIKKILKRDPFANPGDKLSLHLAVKGWKLLSKK